MKICDLMTENPHFCTPDDSVIECAQIMARENVGVVPICESRDTRRAIGVITDRDLTVRVIAEGKDPHAVPSLHDVMTHELVTCAPTDDDETVKRLMEEHQLRRILVVDDHGSLIGVVSTADLARELSKQQLGETISEISK